MPSPEQSSPLTVQSDGSIPSDNGAGHPVPANQDVPEEPGPDEQIALLDTWRQMIKSNSLDMVYEGCKNLVRRLGFADGPSMNREAATQMYALVDATEEKARCVVLSGACPILIRWLDSNDAQLVEQAIATLARLTRRAPESCEPLIAAGILPSLCNLFNRDLPREYLRPVSWCLSNIFDRYPFSLKEDSLRGCLPAINHLLGYREKYVVEHASKALLFIVPRLSPHGLQRLVDLGICARLQRIRSDPQASMPCCEIVDRVFRSIRNRKERLGG